MQFRLTVGGVAVALLVWSAGAGPSPLEGQEAPQRPLRPLPPSGLSISPFMEGWYDNGDGSVTISFGYLNRNQADTVRLPVGENNWFEPSEFDGAQPTIFLPGRHRGVFAVTLPADRRNEDIWWNIRNSNGEVHKVPGRARAEAYELDRLPRPQGSLQPMVWFGSENEAGGGPEGVEAEQSYTTSVGEPLTLSINTRDPSERDPEDPRYREPVPIRVVWSPFQGPGEVTFTRHESTVVPEESEEEDDDGGPRRRRSPPGPEEITLDQGHGEAYVIAAFSEPGDYVLRAQVDNWNASDSSSGDQCCWSNGYVRVTVEP